MQIDKKIQEKLKRKRKIEQLRNYAGEDELVRADAFYEEMKKRGDDGRTAISTGFDGLDSIFEGGFSKGELVVVTGYTNSGKTPLMLNLAYNFYQMGENAIYFSFELSPENLINRLNPEENLDYLKFYLPRKNVANKLQWLYDRILEGKYKNDIKSSVIFIDHLDHIVEYVDKGDTEERLIRNTMRSIHEFALQEDLLIFIAAHSRRPEYKQEYRPPSKHQLKGSQSIEGYADHILTIHRLAKRNEMGDVVKDSEGEIELGEYSKIYVRKNRLNGELKSIRVKHNGRTKRFEEVGEKEDKPEFGRQEALENIF